MKEKPVYEEAYQIDRAQVLENDLRKWRDYNFPDNTAYDQFMGVVEEIGELAHAMLKMKQGIRGTKKKHMADIKDAVGDILIFLDGLCQKLGFSMMQVYHDTAVNVVLKRDWVQFPKNGMTE